jgi:hypothetical protein
MDVPTVVPIDGPLEEPVGYNNTIGCSNSVLKDVPMDLAMVVPMVVPVVPAPAVVALL